MGIDADLIGDIIDAGVGIAGTVTAGVVASNKAAAEARASAGVRQPYYGPAQPAPQAYGSGGASSGGGSGSFGFLTDAPLLGIPNWVWGAGIVATVVVLKSQ